MAKLDPKYDYKFIKTNRSSGILLHISSLPGPYGIGTLGKYAREFVDFLDDSGQTYWQMLPVGPTGYGDSPYQSFSTFAGNPYFIDLDMLVEDGLLTQEEIESIIKVEDDTSVDYGRLYIERYEVLRMAFDKFDLNSVEFINFVEENRLWLDNYSMFMSIKEHFDRIQWNMWPDDYKYRNKETLIKFKEQHIDEINFQKFLQYKFFEQWYLLKSYCNEKGIRIIGDLPIYVAEDSSDLWSNPEFFQLNEDLTLKYVGGCPPDGFSDDGQLWGNPVYNWEKLEEDNYKWWVNRLGGNLKIFDVIRLDHFRGFESYWSIPGGDDTAKFGTWVKGPGIKLFNKIKEALGEISIIAEDLGYMTEEVHNFREATGFPSMKVLQFAFDPLANSDYLPHNYVDNCVVYTGTHDNDTIQGWVKNAREEEIELATKYFNITKEETFNWGLIRGAMTSVANTAIFQMQDFLFLGNEARMNNPGTLGDNWKWRMEAEDYSFETSKILRELTRISGRMKSS